MPVTFSKSTLLLSLLLGLGQAHAASEPGPRSGDAFGHPARR
jgi:glycerophosphoryl diester phosphodiesterase